MTLGADTHSFADTFPKLLLIQAVRRGSRPAMRMKQHWRWRTWTWEQALEEVRSFAVGLCQLKVQRDDRVAIIGRNRPRLYWAICAAQSLGAIPVPLDPDSSADEMAVVLAHAGAKVAVVEGEEEVDKLLSISERLPMLGMIVHDGPLNQSDREPARLKSFEDVQKLGREAGTRPAALAWEREIGKGRGSDVSVILYVPGAAGRPRGVMLSHGGLIATARNANAFDRIGEREIVVAGLPMAWAGDHLVSYAQSLVAGYCVACAQSPQTLFADLRRIGVSYLVAPLVFYDNLSKLAMGRIDGADFIRRRVLRYYLEVAARWGEKILNRERVPRRAWLIYQCGDMLVYGGLRNRFGFSRIRVAYAVGEGPGNETVRFFRSLGINLKQLYGRTEASLWIAAQPDREVHAGTVGRPLPGVEVWIDDNGELLIRSRGVFAGYYKDPDTSAEIKTPEGWMHTGDAGIIDSKTGHLKIAGRAKDVGRPEDATRFAPKHIENLFKSHPTL